MPEQPSHPGLHIRQDVLPKDMPVKKAAELLGVGRPALSNLLNGNAALSPDMSKRLEKAFNADAQDLLARQAAYDEFRTREKAKELAIRTHVPTFLGIEARQIEAWSDQERARSELPALLRRLTHSTGIGVSKAEFPAFDNAQRHGWDGYVEADAATPWIPRGFSGWEFGCNQNPTRKAEDDYDARTRLVAPDERLKTTFIFATPRNWPGKNEWAKAKMKIGAWKDVRAYDASDIEQWLEQSVATQAWFGEAIGQSAAGIQTLEGFWHEWAQASKPALNKILFRAAIASNQDKLLKWLSAPPGKPLLVAADSEGEAVAFVACALEDLSTVSSPFYGRALVVNTVEALRRTTALVQDFVVIATSPEVEAATAGIQATHHLLITRRRSDISIEPDITLGLVDDRTYRDALLAMGLPEPEYPNYARKTAYSPTILRRHLSQIPAIREPAWSADKHLARDLIPLNFAGAWDSENEADREVMRALAKKDKYCEIEQKITELCNVKDAPLWSIGKYRGVTSKIDALFGTHRFMIKQDLDDFFVVAELVLSEEDPAIDLPPDRQWAANIYGKTRQHSAGLRRGLCETLVLLAVHGTDLFQRRLNLNAHEEVNRLVRKLLLPLDGRTWASQKSDLPSYAEAAPEVFLDILQQDLESAEPKVHALLQPVDRSLFGGCPRTGLLWALETLAWKPELLPRVSLLLARLAEIPINDNWLNKPAASLAAIYRAWMPQTAASIEQRNDAMAKICDRSENVGWRLIMDQFGSQHMTGFDSARPRWRNDASGAGLPVNTNVEIDRVADKARELALAWHHHDEGTLGDLVERLHDMSEVDRERVWELIKAWSASDGNDAARHGLRERIRTTAFTRRAKTRGIPQLVKDRAREAYGLLAPKDLIMRHLWLFAQHWVEESADEIEDEAFDYQKHEARISAQRKAALDEIWLARGYDGILWLCEFGGAEGVIGSLLADGIIPLSDWPGFLDQLLRHRAPPSDLKIDSLLSGFIRDIAPPDRDTLLKGLLKAYVASASADSAIRLLKCGPFRADIWTHVETLPEDWQERYWSEAYVSWQGQDEGEFNTLVDRLLDVGRPRAAFNAIHRYFDKLETHRLAKLLKQAATSSSEPTNRFQLDPHHVSEAFKSLKKRFEIDENELAQLEFLYAETLNYSQYGLPTLEAVLARDPRLFIQLVALTYRRNDGGEDAPEWNLDDEKHQQNVATTAFTVLRRVRQTPGSKKDGSIDVLQLRNWVDEARAFGRLYGRETICDQLIGEILGRCLSDPDGVWPCKPVRDVFDAISSQEMANGMANGRYNRRGPQWRDPGGGAERDLAAQYRAWAAAVAIEHPFTARLLEKMGQSYDHEAAWHDTETDVARRIGY
jgi:addiction module HigA family antidote